MKCSLDVLSWILSCRSSHRWKSMGFLVFHSRNGSVGCKCNSDDVAGRGIHLNKNYDRRSIRIPTTCTWIHFIPIPRLLHLKIQQFWVNGDFLKFAIFLCILRIALALDSLNWFVHLGKRLFTLMSRSVQSVHIELQWAANLSCSYQGGISETKPASHLTDLSRRDLPVTTPEKI